MGGEGKTRVMGFRVPTQLSTVNSLISRHDIPIFSPFYTQIIKLLYDVYKTN